MAARDGSEMAKKCFEMAKKWLRDGEKMAPRWRKNGYEMAKKMAAIQPLDGKKMAPKIFKMEWQKRWHFAIPSAIRWIEMAWIYNSVYK